MNEIEIVTIIANGAICDPIVLRRNLAGTNILIAADGGAEICRELKLVPQYIIGDLDSVSDDTIAHFAQAKIIHIPEQDTTDLEKSLSFAERFSPDKIKIFGAVGNRSDHFINNLLFFLRYPNSSLLEIYDDLGVFKILLPGINKIAGTPGEIISFFSLSQISGLQLENFRYVPSQNDYPDNFFSISNELLTETGCITFKAGKLLIYHLLESAKIKQRN